MEKESYAVISVDDKVLTEEIKVANDLIDNTLKTEFEKIFTELDKLNIQQRLFFLDRIIKELLIKGNLSSFYEAALWKHIDSNMSRGKEIDVRDYSASYLG